MPDSNLPLFSRASRRAGQRVAEAPTSPALPPDTFAPARVESPRTKRDAGASGEQEDHG